MSHEPVTIRTYDSQPQAEADRMHLEAAGFTAVLNDAETVGMNYMLGTALGALKNKCRSRRPGLLSRFSKKPRRQMVSAGKNGASAAMSSNAYRVDLQCGSFR
jgi:hypothetical protein